MRPAIDRRNIRRQQPPVKFLRTVGNWIAAYTIAIATVVVFVHIFDPELNPFI